ncbi:MAG: substrate binding domain-containing protein [Bdellovibrionia bacterium]
MGELEDSSLMSRRIGSLDMQLYASPHYLKIHEEPRGCADLIKHECIRFTGEEDSPKWHLKGPKGEHTIEVSGRISLNNMLLVRELALAGQGIALMPYYLCTEDVQTGRLIPILKNWLLVLAQFI